MQNKANFRKSQVNVNPLLLKDYVKKSNWTLGENKPNSNPNKANFQKAQMNVNSLITKDYIKYDDFLVRINKANLLAVSKMPKMNITSATTVNYINELRTTNYELIMKNKAKTKPISKTEVRRQKSGFNG